MSYLSPVHCYLLTKLKSARSAVAGGGNTNSRKADEKHKLRQCHSFVLFFRFALSCFYLVSP
jgi:hypothetical protein